MVNWRLAAAAALLLLATPQGGRAAAAAAAAASPSWWEQQSGVRCARNDVHEPMLVVISMDGFAARYLDLGVTPAIASLGRNGARAEHIYSAYPSRTFVNHYTMATGLFAESHGIVDNHVLDRSISDDLEEVSRTKKKGFFRGDPIWSAYKKQRGGTTACLYWIGCGENGSGIPPDYNPPYNGSATTERRIDQVLAWLALPASRRPNLIMAYLGEPDNVGHFRQHDEEITAVLRENDAVVDRLMSGIEGMGMIDCVNVVLVSDHGMTDVTDRVYWDEHIPLEGLVPAYGVVGRIYRNGTARSSAAITAPFQCTGGGKYRVYDRATLPVKYHFSATPRVGDFIFEGQPGTTFYATKSDDWMMHGDHGYDPVHPRMRTIFFARGPSIRQGVLLQPFQNVEYFNIFAELLGMRAESTPTNGTLGIVDELFARPPPRVTTRIEIPSCPLLAGGGIFSCSSPQSCPADQAARLAAAVAACSPILTLSPISAGQLTSPGYCSLRLCERELLTGPSTVISEFLTPQGIAESPRAACSFDVDERFCTPAAGNQSFFRTSLLLTTNDDLAGIARARVPLLAEFVKNFLGPLDTLTRRYAARYQRVGVISGTIFDANSDGRVDEPSERQPMPSHVFRILFTCPVWRLDGLGCADPAETRPLTFILPHIERDINCMSSEDYLFAHTARVRDVEGLTGLQFFSDANVAPPEIALKIRTYIPQKLWAA